MFLESAHQHSAGSFSLILVLLASVVVPFVASLQESNANHLPFGDINVLVLTDVHSFIGGHPHNASRNADYGDVLSFVERLRQAQEQQTDIWLVNNGDWIHGTGLAMDGNATALVPLLTEMPFDVWNLGNHEAYYTEVVDLMEEKLVPAFGDAFLTSNTVYKESREPFGSRYRILKGTKASVLVFGFLYDVEDVSRRIEVVPVREAVKESWFRTVLTTETYDTILVLAHMSNEDPLVDTLLTAIREQVGDAMPIQFLTGHTHRRATRVSDFWSRSVEAGGFMDTLGFVSFPTVDTAKATTTGRGKLFQSVFLNTSTAVFKEILGEDVEELRTESGNALSQKIKDTQTALGLDQVVACPIQSYYRDRPFDDHESIWKLWQDHVVPTQMCGRQQNCVMILSTNSWRQDIHVATKDHPMTVDEVVAIAPFMEPVIHVGMVPNWAIKRLYSSLNTDAFNKKRKMPDFIMVGEKESPGNEEFDLYTSGYNLPLVMRDLERFQLAEKLDPQPTGQRDTLYWLDYVQQAWPCGREPTKVVPWFAHISELEEEATDGHQNIDEEMDIDMDDIPLDDDEKNNNKNKKDESDLVYQGYHGYLSPATAALFGDTLPPGAAPTVILKPEDVWKPPTPAPVVHHSKAATKQERAKARKKIRRKIMRILAVIVTVTLLGWPLLYLVQTIRGKHRVSGDGFDDDDDEDGVFYDKSEVQALKTNGASGKKRGSRGRRRMPVELELT